MGFIPGFPKWKSGIFCGNMHIKGRSIFCKLAVLTENAKKYS